MLQKNILILGGSRFIGYSILLELLKEEYDITIFNRQITIPPAPFPKQTKFFRGNRDDPDDLKNLFKQTFDVVIDLSGFKSDHVKPIIKENSSRIGQYIFISSIEVYKKPLSNPITEQSPRIFVKSTYGGDKSLIEEILLNSKKELPVTIFRPQGVFGPYDPCLSGLLFYRITKNLPIIVGKNANVQTNHLYISDLIQAIKLSIGNSKTFGKIYNISGDDKINLFQFINLCGEICSTKPKIKQEETISKYKKINFIKKRRHVDFFAEWPEFDMICSNNLIKDELKIKFTNLNESLSETYSWLINNTQHLNYFSLRGENYILNNISVPFNKKLIWKLIDLLAVSIIKLKNILNGFKLLRKIYYLFKNIIVTRKSN